MTDLLSDVDTPSDAELISSVRGGDVAAYGELFSRHRDAANRLARQLVRGPDSDDLVAEAFAKVLSVLQGGGGPDVAFRAYLLTAVRRLHVDRIRAGQRLQTTDDLTPFDPGVPFQDTAVAGFESGAAAKAFASLPERWQLVLWHLEVEGQKPADIAPLLGMSANSVSALAYRAREGLRQAFLTMHLSDISETECRWVNEHLGAFVRQGLAKRDAGKVQGHLDGCRRCTAMYLELTEVELQPRRHHRAAAARRGRHRVPRLQRRWRGRPARAGLPGQGPGRREHHRGDRRGDRGRRHRRRGGRGGARRGRPAPAGRDRGPAGRIGAGHRSRDRPPVGPRRGHRFPAHPGHLPGCHRGDRHRLGEPLAGACHPVRGGAAGGHLPSDVPSDVPATAQRPALGTPTDPRPPSQARPTRPDRPGPTDPAPTDPAPTDAAADPGPAPVVGLPWSTRPARCRSASPTCAPATSSTSR